MKFTSVSLMPSKLCLIRLFLVNPFLNSDLVLVVSPSTHNETLIFHCHADTSLPISHSEPDRNNDLNQPPLIRRATARVRVTRTRTSYQRKDTIFTNIPSIFSKQIHAVANFHQFGPIFIAQFHFFLFVFNLSF